MSHVRNLQPMCKYDLYARARAPCRDYYGLTVDEDNITLNVWKITHGPHLLPRERLCPLEDAPYDNFFQEEVKNVFGHSICQYLVDLGNNDRKLENLPTNLFVHVLKYLGITDILNLAQTSKIFNELCNTEPVWCMMFKKALKKNPTPDDKVTAFDYGWKEVLKMKMLLIKKASESKLKETKQGMPQKKKSSALTQNKKPPAIAPKRNMIKAK